MEIWNTIAQVRRQQFKCVLGQDTTMGLSLSWVLFFLLTVPKSANPEELGFEQICIGSSSKQCVCQRDILADGVKVSACSEGCLECRQIVICNFKNVGDVVPQVTEHAHCS